MEIEKRVYRRLGKHQHLPVVIDIDEYGIYMERADPGCLRLYYKEGGKATPEERIKWCQDVAEVLHYVHRNNIRHADLSGKNLLIDSARSILLCDFSGSSIDDDRATIVAEAGFRHPDEREYRPPTIRAEIHALGSTIYEIVTGRKPFHEKTEEQEREVDKLMKEGEYPDVNELPLGDVIAKCWKRDGFFNSAADVAEEITRSNNPTANIAGNQHWGHATSRDLYTWTNQQIAIFPGSPTEGIFSGSAVVDSNNTSGFFPNQTNGIVAIYTVHTREREVQDIAYSLDGGYTFTKYANNPVVGSNSTQFRDPKVIWYAPTQRWIMVIAYPVDFEIGIFSSQNLREWTHESNFTRYGLTGWQYECPNMVQVRVENSTETRWVMLVSINPGAPLGGSISWYAVGTFNGTHFESQDSIAKLTDFAKDNYAGQFFYGIGEDKDQVTLNWASNWQYTNVVPTAGTELGDGFRSVMTVPRGHFLRELPRVGLSLMSYPWGIRKIAESQLASNNSLGNGTVLIDYAAVKSKAIYFEANVTGLDAAATLQGTLNFTFSSSNTGEYITGGFFIQPDNNLWLDRGHTNGFENPYFTDKFSATALYNENGDGEFRISGVVDRSIVEVFLNEGEISATSVFFSTQPLDTMGLRVRGLNESATVSIGVWALRAAWLDQADVNGTVAGNFTEEGNSTAVGL
ncbi:hypothetical protein CC80DRAFT_545039 [Byssothecium circinans]|uniref:EKC/KEOPS complex subunit BUD32 n=1 Tax=Byssothecium circinans TaxID=147558 RepID=A0A6A5U384_9PLEO|nr:hypothetical protein CC80DRAFT_545039 [Byssothecium circinans]